MLNFENPSLKSGKVADLLIEHGLLNFHEAVLWVWKLPYGRVSDRANFFLVPIEQRGACSTKHAFLKSLAEEQGVDIELCIGIFMMNKVNTPEVEKVLLQSQLDDIPEAHCYLRFKDKRYDFTSYKNHNPYMALNIIHEEMIQPEQIGSYKVSLHKKWIRKWAKSAQQILEPDELWDVREKCIEALSL